VDEVSIGDITGHAQGRETTGAHLIAQFPIDKLAMHFHDTYGLAVANAYQSLEMAAKFDSSAGGLGGCPYAPGLRQCCDEDCFTYSIACIEQALRESDASYYRRIGPRPSSAHCDGRREDTGR
jgi:hydroxymethylglutaryl-CoA lyase